MERKRLETNWSMCISIFFNI